MRNFKKIICIIVLCLTYTSITYFTFGAVARAYKTHNPLLAKKVVILAFLVNIGMLAGGGYLIYKLKVFTEKK
jgi:hypothetical protein